MELEQTTPEDKSPPPRNSYKKYALLTAPLAVLALLALGLSFFFRSDTPTLSPPPPPTTTEVGYKTPKIKLALFAKDLPNTTAIVSRQGDDRLFVLDQDGLVRIVKPDGSVAEEPFLDIKSKVLFRGEMGLLGMALSPNYETDGHFFINYVDNDQRTVVARYHALSANRAEAGSEQRVLTVDQPYANHNGGAVVFGPDGYLYIALGDGGSRGDPQNRAQNTGLLLGKVLRLDVDNLPYSIPDDNPLVGQAGKRAEIWGWGLRNPWRISFDRQTKELYIADVGQGDYEEVNIETGGKGGNDYGWRCYEGLHDFNLAGCGNKNQYVFPALEYDHSEGRCSITGGFVYRGKKFPALDGRYFYGDYCGGQLYYAVKNDSNLKPTLAADTGYKISTFGENSQGELYLADYGSGNIYRIEDTAN
ncbi:MAG TPA: PQQ-dependent sugar dehydrogenase [Candidatus Saccharimonadales bacterium]|nr:PQQ-dependent sugar dehydrogenase [Candidatus Saccharimonadales bacterium]